MTENDLKYWKQTLSGVVPKELVTPEVVALRDQQNKMLNLMAKKNADYGNAFNKGCNDLGINYGLARIYDKSKRVINLISNEFKGYASPYIKDETLLDTIQDLGNYCNMILAWFNNYIADIKVEENNENENVYYDVYNCIVAGSSVLVSETTHKDITEEIKKNYGLDNLCRDNDGYIYNVNKDNSQVTVTTDNGENVIIMSKSLYKDKYDKLKFE